MIYIWNLETNELTKEFLAHFLGILSMKYDEFTNYLITSSYDDEVKIFNCNNYELVKTLITH